MIARALGAVALAASLGFAAPGVAPVPAPAAATGIASDHAPVVQRVEDAVLRATYANVPGASGSGWVLTDLQRSATGIGGMEFVVAKGVLTNAGAPDIELRLTGRFDPDTGELARVAYKLQAATPALPAASQGWSVQQAVEDAFAQVLPDHPMRFALDSAQATRVDGGGRRFDGVGIGTWNEGEARFVAFTLTLSAQGELVEFDYGMPPGESTDVDYLASY